MKLFNSIYFNIFFASISVFLFFKNNFNNLKINKKQNKIIQNISKLTFGIYLIHPLIIETIIKHLHFFNLQINIIVLIPMLNIFIFLLSLIISLIIKNIPFIGDYLI